jgi:hypothetical protein
MGRRLEYHPRRQMPSTDAAYSIISRSSVFRVDDYNRILEVQNLMDRLACCAADFRNAFLRAFWLYALHVQPVVLSAAQPYDWDCFLLEHCLPHRPTQLLKP